MELTADTSCIYVSGCVPKTNGPDLQSPTTAFSLCSRITILWYHLNHVSAYFISVAESSRFQIDLHYAMSDIRSYCISEMVDAHPPTIFKLAPIFAQTRGEQHACGNSVGGTPSFDGFQGTKKLEYDDPLESAKENF